MAKLGVPAPPPRACGSLRCQSRPSLCLVFKPSNAFARKGTTESGSRAQKFSCPPYCGIPS
ncbi:hypothetical protein CsSME_00020316 [Camellia sinensis var. sinensis]